MDEAKRVHARLQELKRQTNKATAELALLLANVKRRKLHRAFQKTSVAEYAVCFGFVRSASKANDLVRTVEDLQAAPGLREDSEKGDLEWTKVRTAAAAVRAGGDPEVWRKRAHEHTGSALEALAAEERGEPAPVRWSVKFSREEQADVEGALAEVRAQHGRELTDGQALAILCRGWRATQAGGGGGGRSSKNPANRIVIHRCACGGKAWQETRSGRVPVSPERLEAAACDAEVFDVRAGPTRITKTVPPRIRRHVLDRAGHRCTVPGCGSVGYLHVHHEPGRAATGHDPDRMTPLCDEHHLQRHEGWLEVREEGAGRFRFFRLDGTEITGGVGQVAATAATTAPRSCERPGEAEASAAEGPAEPERHDANGTGRSCERPGEPQDEGADADADEELDDLARRALGKLGLKAREAAAAVERAREALLDRDGPITLEALLAEALSRT